MDLDSIITPVNADVLHELLQISEYDENEIDFLVNGFHNGFDIGYEGPQNCTDLSRNIPFQVGSHEEMWSKIMKEVKLGRFAGPYESIPFDNYVQSPIGLVPKKGGKTRLIDFPLVSLF